MGDGPGWSAIISSCDWVSQSAISGVKYQRAQLSCKHNNFFISRFIDNKIDILIYCVLISVIISQVALNFGWGNRCYLHYYYCY